MRGPMLTFVLLGVFIIFLYMSIAFVSFMDDLTGLPVYLLLYMSPVYLIGVYVFWTKAKESYQERKFKKLIALFYIVFLAFASPISVILAAVPNWSLTITTDKIMYRLGENVTITAILTNNAYFAKALDSYYSPSGTLEIAVTNGSIPHQYVFMDELVNIGNSVGPRQSLQKTLTWQAINGTGEYYVHVDSMDSIQGFSDQVNITITP
jgi:hypothetical protein